MKTLKTLLLAASLVAFAPTSYADSAYPGELGGMAAQAEQSHQPVVILSTQAALTAFSEAVVAAVGDDKAKLPDNTAFVITPDALAMPGAGENEHAQDPWAVVAFDKDGMKTGVGLFRRGIIEAALKKVQGLPT